VSFPLEVDEHVVYPWRIERKKKNNPLICVDLSVCMTVKEGKKIKHKWRRKSNRFS
jgi:hypothetical protein